MIDTSTPQGALLKACELLDKNLRTEPDLAARIIWHRAYRIVAALYHELSDAPATTAGGQDANGSTQEAAPTEGHS